MRTAFGGFYMKKRIISLFLALIMILSCLSVADETEFNNESESALLLETAEEAADVSAQDEAEADVETEFSAPDTDVPETEDTDETEDIPQALQSLESEGVLYANGLTHEKLVSQLQSRLSDPRVADWFSSRWKLFNECTILSVDPLTNNVVERRPDRVMTDGVETVVVDFKFASPKPEHQRQVLEYMSLLHQMGHQRVKGYLWYVYSNRIEAVNDDE